MIDQDGLSDIVARHAEEESGVDFLPYETPENAKLIAAHYRSYWEQGGRDAHIDRGALLELLRRVVECGVHDDGNAGDCHYCGATIISEAPQPHYPRCPSTALAALRRAGGGSK